MLDSLVGAIFFEATPTNGPNRAFYACTYCAVPNIRYSNIIVTRALKSTYPVRCMAIMPSYLSGMTGVSFNYKVKQ